MTVIRRLGDVWAHEGWTMSYHLLGHLRDEIIPRKIRSKSHKYPNTMTQKRCFRLRLALVVVKKVYKPS